jgi:outer membrane assembly lipoprotein YfiO
MKKPGRDQTNTYALITAFESLIKQYPGTKESEEAKTYISEARQNLATHIFKIGYYNHKLKAHQGAISRFKQVMDEYPDFMENDKLFYYTGKAYAALKDHDSARSFFQQILTRYPKSKYASKATRLIKRIQEKSPSKLD